MVTRFIVISFLLTTFILSTKAWLISDTAPYHNKRLAGRDEAVSAVNAIIHNTGSTDDEPFPCDAANGTVFSFGNNVWNLTCDIDFYLQDIMPFILAKSYQNCLNYCAAYNALSKDGPVQCAGFVWAPDRVNATNDCYLKSSVNDEIIPSTLHLVGAKFITHLTPSTAIAGIPPTSTSTPQAAFTILTSYTATPTNYVTGAAAPSQAQPPQKVVRRPMVTGSTSLGTSVNKAAAQYVSHVPAKPAQIAGELLQAGIDIGLINDYPLAPDTGTWTSQDVSDDGLANMTIAPRLSRDGGRGGNINGTNIFIFCDTSTYGEEKDAVLGYLNGFVSSSVAVDETMDGLEGKPLTLVNSLGQWQDDVGRMRGWVPMTTGEEAFNQAISGDGYRYAVWPNSSPININYTHAVIYAPLVYVEVDMQAQDNPSFTGLGNTLVVVSIDQTYGPHADRLQNQFFTQDEINWGSLGGIRAWSANGVGSAGGDIYVFGQADDGILLGKVADTDFTNLTKYTYWNGQDWSSQMPPNNSFANAYVIEQPVMNMDVIYSHVHQTFVMVYLTPDADNTFYYRYLVGKDNSTLNILPPYVDDGDSNYVENLLTQKWSDSEILFTVPAPERGYAYAGGLHAGYFGDDDITNGGTRMLCTWTEHTEVDPNDPASGYAHKSQVVELGWDN